MSSPKPNRASFFVDGFNLYHSVCSAQKVVSHQPMKWLDLHGLFEDHLDLVGRGAVLASVRYYTAYAEHLNGCMPDKLRRHRAYVRALTATGVTVEFKTFGRGTISKAKFDEIGQYFSALSRRSATRGDPDRIRRPPCWTTHVRVSTLSWMVPGLFDSWD